MDKHTERYTNTSVYTPLVVHGHASAAAAIVVGGGTRWEEESQDRKISLWFDGLQKNAAGELAKKKWAKSLD